MGGRSTTEPRSTRSKLNGSGRGGYRRPATSAENQYDEEELYRKQRNAELASGEGEKNESSSILPDKPGTGFEAFLEKGLALAGSRRGGGGDNKTGAVFGKGWAKGLSRGQAIEKARSMYANLDDGVRKKYEDRANLKDVRSDRDNAAHSKYKQDRAAALGLGQPAPKKPTGSVQRINGVQKWVADKPKSSGNGPKPSYSPTKSKPAAPSRNPIKQNKERKRYDPGSKTMVDQSHFDKLGRGSEMDPAAAAKATADKASSDALKPETTLVEPPVAAMPATPPDPAASASAIATPAPQPVTPAPAASPVGSPVAPAAPAAKPAASAKPAEPVTAMAVGQLGAPATPLLGNTSSALGMQPSTLGNAVLAPGKAAMAVGQGAQQAATGAGIVAGEVGGAIKNIGQAVANGAQTAAGAVAHGANTAVNAASAVGAAVGQDAANLAKPAPPQPRKNNMKAVLPAPLSKQAADPINKAG